MNFRIVLSGCLMFTLAACATPANIVTPSNQSRSSEIKIPSYWVCKAKGTAYYKEIGRYPYLSTGEYVPTKIEGMCSRSGLAFGQ